MLFTIIFFLLLALGGALIGQWVTAEPGYVYVQLGEWTFETSLWLGSAVVLLFLLGVWFTYKSLRGLVNIPRRIRIGLYKKRSKLRESQLRRALIYLSSRNYQKILAKPKPIYVQGLGLNLQLIRLAACLEQKRYDDLLLLCEKLAAHKGKLERQEKTELLRALAVFRAQAYRAQGKCKQALELLLPHYTARAASQEDQEIFSLVRDLHLQEENWEKLGEVLRAADANEPKNFAAILSFYQHCGELRSIRQLWESLSAKSRANPELLAAYALACNRNNDKTEVVKLLQNALKKHAAAPLFEAYTQLVTDKPLQQLKFLEDLRHEIPNPPESLLLALGNLSASNKFLEKALSYYALLLEKYPNTARKHRAVYASLLDQSGTSANRKKADELYRSMYELPYTFLTPRQVTESPSVITAPRD